MKLTFVTSLGLILLVCSSLLYAQNDAGKKTPAAASPLDLLQPIKPSGPSTYGEALAPPPDKPPVGFGFVPPSALTPQAAQTTTPPTAAPAQPQPAADTPGVRRALVIGMENYAHLAKREFAASDAQAIGNSLIAGGYDPDLVKVMNDSTSNAQLLPTKENLARELSALFTTAGPKDLILVVVVGHAVNLEGASYLCPVDGQLDNLETLLPLTAWLEKFAASKASAKVLMADVTSKEPRLANRRESDPESKVKDLVATLTQPPKGVVILASSATADAARDDVEKSRGLFCRSLLESFSEAADADQNGRVSLLECGSHIEDAYLALLDDSVEPAAGEDAELAVMVLSLQGEPRRISDLWGDLKPALTNSVGMEMRLIPPGQFMMGCNEASAIVVSAFPYMDQAKLNAEFPPHKVRITKPFYMGTCEVSLGQFKKFYDEGKYQLDCERIGEGWGFTGDQMDSHEDFTPWSWGARQSLVHPVVNVSWNDCVAFCRWLSAKEGVTYRLPTEAEWEYACRAGTNSRYPMESKNPADLIKIANIADMSAAKTIPNKEYLVGLNGRWEVQNYSDGFPFSAPCGSFAPNGFGLRDMIGNVSEWVADGYATGYYGKSPADDPRGPANSNYRVSRGGSWRHDASKSRSSYRTWDAPDATVCSMGFRVVREESFVRPGKLPPPPANEVSSESFAVDLSKLDTSLWQPAPEKVELKNRQLCITTKAGEGTRCFLPDRKIQNVDMELRITHRSGDGKEYGGIVFWGEDEANYHSAQVNASGRLLIRLGARTKTNLLQCKSIKAGIGIENILRVVTIGPQVKIFVNGLEAASFTGNPGAGEDKVGIASIGSSFANKSAEIAFSNLTVRPSEAKFERTINPAEDGSALFVDDFSKPLPDWTEGNPAVTVDEGLLMLTQSAGHGELLLYREKAVEDVNLRVSLMKNGGKGTDSKAGIIFWAADEKNYFAFFLHQNGKVSIEQMEDGTLNVLAEPIEDAAVRTKSDDLNELQVLSSGHQAVMRINGTEFARINLPHPEKFYVGLAIGAGEQGSNWLFSDFAMRRSPAPEEVQDSQDPSLLFVDDFRALPEAWGPPTDILSVQGNKLLVYPASKIARAQVYDTKYDDADVRVTVAAYNSPLPMAGLIFWCTSPRDYYAALFKPDGSCQLARKLDGQWQDLAPRRTVKEMKPGLETENQLRVVTRGDTITVYVNGAEVMKLDSKRPEGPTNVGMYAESVEKRTLWEFSKFEVRKPQ